MTHRLWFRTDDVAPLAEHAMACLIHRLTEAQTRAGAPLRPALTWHGAANLDILRSNGVPIWYGERGTVHAAEAHTWRHTATGRYGTANLDRYRSAYLPLDVSSSGPTIIDVLRDARHSGLHWITVDIDPADRHLIRPGRIRAVDHRDQLVPADATWVEATVTCTAVAGYSYPALVPDGYTTDAGHLLPRFDRPTVEQLVADLDAIHANPDRDSDPMPGEYPLLRLSDDLYGNVLQNFEESDNGVETSLRQVDLVHPDRDGRYSVGAYGWPWQLAVPALSARDTGC